MSPSSSASSSSSVELPSPGNAEKARAARANAKARMVKAEGGAKLMKCQSPPFRCAFCGQTYHTAQALGGHQNAHRLEREKMKEKEGKVVKVKKEKGEMKEKEKEKRGIPVLRNFLDTVVREKDRRKAEAREAMVEPEVIHEDLDLDLTLHL